MAKTLPENVADVKVLDAIRKLACRSMSGYSEQLPLLGPIDDSGEDVDLSMGGRFWVQFRDADAAEKSAISGSFVKERVVGGGEVIRESSSVAVMDTLIRQGLIRDANLPKADDTKADGLGDLAWPKHMGPQKELIRPRDNTEDPGVTWALMNVIVGMAMDFYVEDDDEVVEELGESSATSESNPSETPGNPPSSL